jgi:hypothetical protein
MNITKLNSIIYLVLAYIDFFKLNAYKRLIMIENSDNQSNKERGFQIYVSS